MAEPFDALVIGGGPGGATAALLLARAGWSVVLLEKKPFPRRKVCGEYLSGTNLPLLDAVGVGDAFRAAAGPEVRRVGLFTRAVRVTADLPRPDRGGDWGRALGRESLDSLILQAAMAAGVEVRQPCAAAELRADGDGYSCRVKPGAGGDIWARVVVAAHGSWEPGPLPTQPARARPRPDDLLGFKAHFCESALPAGLMPLLVFPGGYGGMVHCDGGRVSLSLCIRRDYLARVRFWSGGEAGEAVLGYLLESCRGVREALAGARREGGWLSAGPIRPGIRLRNRGGIFAVGNAAGEAHPAIAEGISMAIQSAWLLAPRLIAWRNAGADRAALRSVGGRYAVAWRRAFRRRVRVSAVVARLAMSPACSSAVLPLFRYFPEALSWAARLSGKATRAVPLH